MSQGGILNYVASTPSIPTSFSTDAGTGIPVANLLQILGGEGIDTSAAGNVLTITGEIATAGATLALSNLGIAAFNSANFSVVNGFVSLTGVLSFPWTREAGNVVACVPNHGYINTNGALTTFTLPIASALGDIIYILGEGLGGWAVAQNAGQNIQVGNLSSTIGVLGSLASSLANDSIMLVCRVANTTWQAMNAPVGVLNVI